MRNFKALGVFLLCFLGASEALGQNTVFRNFWHPTYLGAPLDYCTIDGAMCGQEVADQFCHLLGYDYSNKNTIAYHVGVTKFLATNALCKGCQCNGFMNIGCALKIRHQPPQPYHYTEKKFIMPQYKQRRVDWCYSHCKDCGTRAANSFCARMGYLRAKHFAQEINLPATETIGSQELCLGQECSGFSYIICSR